jgi:pimeloyl-ACP methyl ester carboxylesterase
LNPRDVVQQGSRKQLINGVEIAYEDLGSGPAVVLLHGYPFNRSLWRDQVSALRGDFRVIAPDLRGHGESAVTSGASTMEAMANDVACLLDLLDISQATIGGLSMGGYVALAFSRLFPSRVQALVLAATRAQADTEEAVDTRNCGQASGSR